MRDRVVRALDVVAALLALAVVIVLATGGATVGGLPLTRAEDFLVALAVAAGIRALLRAPRLPAVPPRGVVIGGVVLYAAVMSFIVVTGHQALRSHALDLGQIVQLLWGIANGHGPRMTLVPTYVAGDQMNAWGDHLYLVLYAFVPLQWVAPGAVPLLIAQTLILAAGGFAVFAHARRQLGDERAAAAFALLYLVNPSLHGINLRDIHSAAFAIPLLVAAAAAFDARRPAWCATALALTLLCREDAAVAVVGFGVWLALARRRWAVGALVAVVAVGVLAVDIHWLMPYLRGAPYNHLNRYAHLGSSLGEVLVSIVLRPWRWIAVVATPAKLVYLLALLAPLGLLPLLAPRALAAAVPALAMNLLSFDPVLVNYRAQYQAFALPFLVLAAVDGYARLRAARARRPAVVAGVALTLAFTFSVVLTARTVNDLGVRYWRLDAGHRAAYDLMRQIPASAAVSANERLVPHLAMRPDIWVFPRGVPRGDYVVELAALASRVPADAYELVGREGAWALWRRR